MKLRHTWPFLLFLSFAACRTQPSTQDLAKELQTITSWAATAQMVSQAWLQNRVPVVYAKQTLRKVQDNLQIEFNTLAKVTPLQHRVAAFDRVKQLQHTIQQIETEIERQDRTALAQNLQVLSNRKQAIQTLIQVNGEQP
jgi:hypothetical protein